MILKANDVLKITTNKPWTNTVNNEKLVQQITFLAKVTNVFSNRFEYEASKVLEHTNVMPDYSLTKICGGIAFRALNTTFSSTQVTKVA